MIQTILSMGNEKMNSKYEKELKSIYKKTNNSYNYNIFFYCH